MNDWGFCPKHQFFYYPEEGCTPCARESAPTLNDTLNMHEARIADLEERLLRTNRVLAELVKRFESMRRAHNAVARANERLLTQVEQMLAQEQPNAKVYR